MVHVQHPLQRAPPITNHHLEIAKGPKDRSECSDRPSGYTKVTKPSGATKKTVAPLRRQSLQVTKHDQPMVHVQHPLQRAPPITNQVSYQLYSIV